MLRVVAAPDAMMHLGVTHVAACLSATRARCLSLPLSSVQHYLSYMPSSCDVLEYMCIAILLNLSTCLSAIEIGMRAT